MDLAFDSPRTFDPREPQFSEGRSIGAFDGDELAGTVMTYEFSQMFGGRAVACGGVAGVMVAPGSRGLGLARRLLVESFHRMHERGEVISSLYPTTSLLYGGVGYGVAGLFTHREVPFRAIGPSDQLHWSEAEFGCDEMRLVHHAAATKYDGWILPGDGWWDHQRWRRTASPGDRAFTWIGRRGAEPVAAVVYSYGKSEHLLYEVTVQLLAGCDIAAIRSSLSFLAENSSAADTLETTLPSFLLDLALARPELVRPASDWPWMLRLIDLPGAVAARGYPDGIELTLDLDITDSVIDANAGAWRVTVEGGVGRAERGGNAAVAVGIDDLARIYAGIDPRPMYDDGRLEGITPAGLERLTSAFTTQATLPIFF